MEYKSWTVGKVEGSPTTELDKRVEELIRLLAGLTVSIQGELDFIYDTVARRNRGKNCKVQFLVTCEFLALSQGSVDRLIEEIQERIKEQLAGHRTTKRLSDFVNVAILDVHTTSRVIE